MANYRQIHVSIWKDDWFLELETDEKLFFIYLFSNELASLAGIYKLPLKVMAFETGLELAQIRTYLEKFSQADKVHYQDGIVWVKNLRKYNQGSSKVQVRIDKDIEEIPHSELKQKYLSYHGIDTKQKYPMDTLSPVMKCNEGEDEMQGSEGEWETPTTPLTPAIPTTALEASKHPDIQLFKRVSGIFPGESDYRRIIDTLTLLRLKHPDETELESYLLPFWLNWSVRKTQAGEPYSKTNPNWLVEWALNNTIPAPTPTLRPPAPATTRATQNRVNLQNALRSLSNG